MCWWSSSFARQVKSRITTVWRAFITVFNILCGQHGASSRQMHHGKLVAVLFLGWTRDHSWILHLPITLPTSWKMKRYFGETDIIFSKTRGTSFDRVITPSGNLLGDSKWTPYSSSSRIISSSGSVASPRFITSLVQARALDR